MILNLPFKKAWYYTEKPIEIILRIGTLEDLCDDLKLHFWELKEFMEKSEFDFGYLLLYHGYITCCQKKGIRIKYNKSHAVIWYEYMSAKEKVKFKTEMTVLFGKFIESYKPVSKKKVEKKQSGQNSEPLQSVS